MAKSSNREEVLQANLFWSHWFYNNCHHITIWPERLSSIHEYRFWRLLPNKCMTLNWLTDYWNCLWWRFRYHSTWRPAVTPATYRCLSGLWYVKIQRWWCMPEVNGHFCFESCKDIFACHNRRWKAEPSHDASCPQRQDWQDWPGDCSHLLDNMKTESSCFENLLQTISPKSCLFSRNQLKHPT